MPYYPPPSSGGSSEFTDTGTLLHPADLSGAEDVAIGGTTTTAPIVLKGVSGSAGQATFQPTSPINNTPYAAVFDEATTNLVTNPSFEVDTAGWSASGANASISRVTAQKYVGDAALQVVISPTAASQGTVSSSMSTTVSKQYLLSGWLKGNAGSETILIGIIGSSSGATSRAVTLSTSWKRVEVYKTLNGSDTSVTVQFITNGSQAITFFVDAVMLEQKDTTGYQDTFATTYCDGSLGAGYSWSGTAHASSSSRIAGFHVLGPITAGSLNGFVINNDGTIGASHIHFSPPCGDNQEGLFNAGLQNNTSVRAPIFIKGSVPYSVLNFGNIGGLVGIHNTGNGPTLYAKGDSTTQPIVVFDGGSITTGAIIACYAPSDLTNFSGSFLNFADKSGASSYNFKKNSFKIGVPNLNQYHYLQGMGAGAYASTSTAKAGTISSSGTAVTGSSTTFTTDYIVGDLIVASGQKRVITAIGSNTALTTLSAFNPVISGGTTASKADAQYYPFFLTLEGPKGDHENLDYGDKATSLFIDGTDKPKIMRQLETAGTGTISSSGTAITGVGTAFTTELNIGDIIISDSERLVVILVTNNTSLTTRTAPTVALSGDSFTIVNTTTTVINADLSYSYDVNAPTPTADTSGKYILVEEFKDVASKTTTSNQNEQSIFTTTPTIPAGRLGATGTLEITAFGTLAAAGATKNLTIRVKLGATTILTTHAEVLASTAINNWRMSIIIQNTATNAQKTSLAFLPKEATSNIAMDPIIDYETAAVDTTIDKVLDISIQYGVVNNTFTKEAIIAKVW